MYSSKVVAEVAVGMWNIYSINIIIIRSITSKGLIMAMRKDMITMEAEAAVVGIISIITSLSSRITTIQNLSNHNKNSTCKVVVTG